MKTKTDFTTSLRPASVFAKKSAPLYIIIVYGYPIKTQTDAPFSSDKSKSGNVNSLNCSATCFCKRPVSGMLGNDSGKRPFLQSLRSKPYG